MATKLVAKKEQLTFYLLFLNIFFAILIFYSAGLGRYLSLYGAPISISLIWPAAGFSLAGLILFGIRIWPGIFLGNYAFVFLQIYLDSHSTFDASVTALAVASAALMEAVLAFIIIHRYSSPQYFTTLKDIFVFLVPATLLVCMLAATLGAFVLYIYALPTEKVITYAWNAFWVEDTLGMYTFVPLLIVWSSHTPAVKFKDHALQASLMIISFILISIFTFFWGDPMAHLFIPLSLWAAYTFRMHGASLAIFLISLIIVIPTGLGYGAYALTTLYPYFTLSTFLAVTISTSLILAALMNEREDAYRIIEKQKAILQEAFQVHMEDVKEVHGEIYTKERLSSSLGLLTAGIAKHLQIPLKRINNLTKASVYTLTRIKEALYSYKDPALQNNFKILEGYLHSILTFEKQADRIGKIIQEQSSLVNPAKIKVKSVNINKLLNTCILQVSVLSEKKDPDFRFTVVKDFDKEAEISLAFPQDLAQAFLYFLTFAINDMKEKKLKKEHYDPTLHVKTLNYEDRGEVIIQGNGRGLSEKEVHELFHSIITSTPAEDAQGFDLALAHDIIVHVHEGEIKVESKEGEFLRIILILPKPQKSTIHSLAKETA